MTTLLVPSKTSLISTYACGSCGELLLILPGHLTGYPTRKTDEAYILAKEYTRYRLLAHPSPTSVMMKLSDKSKSNPSASSLVSEAQSKDASDKQALYERRRFYHCSKCALPFAYDSDAPDEYLYILAQALSLSSVFE